MLEAAQTFMQKFPSVRNIHLGMMRYEHTKSPKSDLIS